MADKDEQSGRRTVKVREAVALFDDADSLEKAVDELEIHGFDQGSFSLLATDEALEGKLGHLYKRVQDYEDDADSPRQAFVDSNSVTEGKAFAFSVPVYLGVAAGAAGVFATGGTLAALIGAGLAGGIAGTAVGAALAGFLGQRNAERIEKQLEEGGLLLWVSVPEKELEERAIKVLKDCGGRDVHVHEIERPYGITEEELREEQPDPWLTKD